MKKLRFNAILSTLLLLTFLFLAFSGTLLYFNKTGMILGIPRGSFRNAHTLTAGFMCVLTVVHVIIHRRIFLIELKSLTKYKINSIKVDSTGADNSGMDDPEAKNTKAESNEVKKQQNRQ